jgi:hypothetical protein
VVVSQMTEAIVGSVTLTTARLTAHLQRHCSRWIAGSAQTEILREGQVPGTHRWCTSWPRP